MLEIQFRGQHQTKHDRDNHGITVGSILNKGSYTVLGNIDRKKCNETFLIHPKKKQFSCFAESRSQGGSYYECCRSCVDWKIVDFGMVLDEVCDKDWLDSTVDDVRLSLPLDSKRPTVDRRFYHDKNGVIVNTLESIVCNSLHPMLFQKKEGKELEDPKMTQRKVNVMVHCNRYLRILEYHHHGGGLSPHTDGSKICEEFQIPSTHTLLLYLSDCSKGGQTILLKEAYYQYTNQQQQQQQKLKVTNNKKNKSTQHLRKEKKKLPPEQQSPYKELSSKHDNNIGCIDDWNIHENNILSVKNPDCCLNSNPTNSTNNESNNSSAISSRTLVEISTSNTGGLAISPKRGRILLFPHNWPHAGAMIESVPKIMLRAELTLIFS